VFVVHAIEILLVITGFDPQGILYQTQMCVYKAITYKINTNYATFFIKQQLKKYISLLFYDILIF